MEHLRNRIATLLIASALGLGVAACGADDTQSPGQQEGVTDGGDTDGGGGTDPDGDGY